MAGDLGFEEDLGFEPQGTNKLVLSYRVSIPESNLSKAKHIKRNYLTKGMKNQMRQYCSLAKLH